MDAVIETIRIAAAAGASDDERLRGIAACRALAHALEGTLVTDPNLPPLVVAHDSEPEVVAGELVSGVELEVIQDAEPPVTAAVAPNPFAGMSADQILDLVIGRLRDAVGPDASVSPVGRPFNLTLVPVPKLP